MKSRLARKIIHSSSLYWYKKRLRWIALFHPKTADTRVVKAFWKVYKFKIKKYGRIESKNVPQGYHQEQ